MSTKQLSKEEFLRNVATHEITILRDDGLYRHIRFKRPKESYYYFDLITWPGHLCITGDVETWVFSRVPDMFNFFIMDGGDFNYKNTINPDYWSEKLQGTEGFEEFSEEKFNRIVMEIFENYIFEADITADQAKELLEDLHENVLSAESEHEAHAAAIDYEFEDFRFHDFWEHNLKDFTLHYLWGCHAIVWGIKKYREHKSQELFYLQDSRDYVGNDVLWWQKGGNGYTTDLSKAQPFTKEEAFIQQRSRHTDIPWPKAYIDSKTRPAVDMQYIKREEAFGEILVNKAAS